MRKLTAVLILLTLVFSMTASAETAQPNPCGMWATSTEETLCGTVLLLNPDHNFHLNGQGLLLSGKWHLDGYTLTLYDAVSLQTGITGVPQPVSYTLDESCTALDIGGGLHLYRVIPEIEGIRVYFPEAYSGWVSLMLSESKFFLTYTNLSDEHIPPLPEGGYWFEGTWWLEGRCTREDNTLTLYAENGCVYTFTQDMETGFLISAEGYAFSRYYTFD